MEMYQTISSWSASEEPSYSDDEECAPFITSDMSKKELSLFTKRNSGLGEIQSWFSLSPPQLVVIWMGF